MKKVKLRAYEVRGQIYYYLTGEPEVSCIRVYNKDIEVTIQDEQGNFLSLLG